MKYSCILFCLFALLAIGCKKEPTPASKMRMGKVERGKIAQTVVATGKIQPLHQIEIRSKSGGTVRAIFVEEGDAVTKGQKLMEISPESSPTEQVQARQELATAQVELQQAQDRARIAKELYEKKLVPEQNHLDAERDVERAQARLSAAESEWALIQREKIGKNAPDTKGMDIVRSSTTILAPISGIIFTRSVDVGASVTPTTSASGGTVVMTMGDDSEIEFKGDIDEADIGKMKVGLEVNLSVQAYPGKSFKGTVTHISPVGKVDQEEKQTVFSVRALMENPDKLLRVGLTATAKVVVDQRDSVAIVDEMALSFKGDTVTVKVVKDTVKATTEDRVVKVGISDGIRTEIMEGLNGGETVSLGAVEEKKD
ncbi:MAG TPA: efflux RND transporter periplasmic adaptor subunit [bacterium]|jgi:HlyD family secretion protein